MSETVKPQSTVTAADVPGDEFHKRLELNGKLVIPRRVVLAGAAAALLLPVAARAAGKALGIASTMRLHNHETHTRLVVELSDSIEFGLFRLADPYRVVVDLPELDWAVSDMPGAVGLVRAVRFGLFQSGNARMVIDLAGPAGIKNAFVLPATGGTPFRFVIDLEPTDRPAFMAALGPQYRIGQFGGGAQAATAPPKPVTPVKTPEANPKDRKKIVAIDPGHGGVDPGAIGGSGIYEKVITLAAAQQLKKSLEATGRYKVILTRERDVSLELSERREIARAAEADIFVSLHADSMANKSMRGLSVYTSAAPPVAPGHLMPTSVNEVGQRHRGVGGGNLRATVFGVNDGLVSNASLVMGIAGANAEPGTVLMTGVAGLLAGALSMAAGEYVSVRSQRDMYEYQIALEKEELAEYPEEEAEELA